MKPQMLIRIALRSIRRTKMRSTLTALGIIIGVGAVIVMVAIGHGAKSRIESSIKNLGTNMVVITPGAANTGNVRGGAGSFNRLKTEDADKLKREAVHLADVSPVIMAFGRIRGGNGMNWRCPVYGVDTSYQVIRDWQMSDGQFFDVRDVRSRRKVCVLGATVAKNIFGEDGGSPIGQEVILRDVPFTVIGVLAPKGQTASGSDQDDVIIAPYTTVEERLAGHQFIAQILGSAVSGGEVEAAMVEAKSIMRESHGLGEWEEDDFQVKNQADLADAATGATEVMTILLAAIAGISLLVGGIGIMNIMLVSVTERTREIGIRMAIGARPADVLLQFLVEAIVLSMLGGLLGVARRAGAAGGWRAPAGRAHGHRRRHRRRGAGLLGGGRRVLRLLAARKAAAPDGLGAGHGRRAGRTAGRQPSAWRTRTRLTNRCTDGGDSSPARVRNPPSAALPGGRDALAGARKAAALECRSTRAWR
ncbi:MAG: ABC transporter permease [bacterium]|nr:ABC transporter permease [bacterium]